MYSYRYINFSNLYYNCYLETRSFGYIRDRIRPRGGGIRTPSQGRCAQEEGSRTGCHSS